MSVASLNTLFVSFLGMRETRDHRAGMIFGCSQAAAASAYSSRNRTMLCRKRSKALAKKAKRSKNNVHDLVPVVPIPLLYSECIRMRFNDLIINTRESVGFGGVVGGSADHQNLWLPSLIADGRFGVGSGKIRS